MAFATLAVDALRKPCYIIGFARAVSSICRRAIVQTRVTRNRLNSRPANLFIRVYLPPRDYSLERQPLSTARKHYTHSRRACTRALEFAPRLRNGMHSELRASFLDKICFVPRRARARARER